MEKLAYVEPTLTKVVLTSNERIASEVCEPTGSIPGCEETGNPLPQELDEPS